MRGVTWIVVGALVAIPLTVAGAGLASADDYLSDTSTAGPNGASSEITSSSTGSGLPGAEGGGSSFNHSTTKAGPDGASSSGVSSNAG